MPHKDIEKRREYQFKRNLSRRYGMTLKEYDDAFVSQDGKCKICGFDPSKKQRGLHVDHDHVTGKFRGLLCHVCNRYLVGAIEKIGLDKIKEYLKLGL